MATTPQPFSTALLISEDPASLGPWERRCNEAGIRERTSLVAPSPLKFYEAWSHLVKEVAQRRAHDPKAVGLVVVSGAGANGLEIGGVRVDMAELTRSLSALHNGPATAIVIARDRKSAPSTPFPQWVGDRVMTTDVDAAQPDPWFEQTRKFVAYQVGPSVMGFMQYDIWDLSSVIGRLVATGTNPPAGLTANRSYWCWADSTRTTWPTTFKLLYDGSGNGSLVGSNQWTFLDGAFPAATTGPDVSGYTCYSVARGSASGTLVGHLWVKTISGVRHQIWSAYPDQVDTDGMYKGRTTGLYLTTVTAPAWGSDWRWRDDTP